MRTVFICCCVSSLLLLSGREVAAQPREPWTTSKVVGSPDPPPPYQVELAMPNLTFEHPVDIAFAPGSDRVFVVEQQGKIYTFDNSPDAARADLAVDFKQVYKDLTATYALAFHPDFERNHYVYICYVIGSLVEDGSFISRFTVTDANPPTIDLSTEQIILRWWGGGHNGCCLKFGPDGYLYISTGDGAEPAPPDPLKAGQDVSNLLSAILRIDVNHAEGGRQYRIPPDNPFVDLEGARGEIWAYGFRNPWRMSFDRETGELWVGDVGWQLWEMIYRIERGGNYGWSIMEGPQPVLPEEKRGPTPILPPTVSHPHSEASSITGGYVYRGSRLPELNGVYIYGDFQTGTIWGLRHDGKQVTSQQVLARTPLQLVSFGEDKAGELYLLDYERSQKIYRLVRSTSSDQHAAFPRRLSDTGIFSTVQSHLVPSAGVIPYEINAHNWSDYTTSERWMAVPGTAPLEFQADGTLGFPDGSVLAKTISIQMRRGDPTSQRRLETQILHRHDKSWRPYTYIWNDEQTDADLVDDAGATLELQIEDAKAPGGLRLQTYRVASRTECQTCHNPWVETKTTVYGVQTASPLATSILQLNRAVDVEGSMVSQLANLQHRGWLAGDVQKYTELPKLSDPYDSSADLNQRARAYLHVNCSHCHQPHAGGASTIELMYEVKLEDAKAIDVRPTQGTFGISDARIIAPGDPMGSVLLYRISKLGGGRMPRLGSSEVDEQGVALIHDWIAQMPRATTSELPPENAALIQSLQAQDLSQYEHGIGQLLSSTRGGLALMRLIDQGMLSTEARELAISRASKHEQSEIRDLFERFVPAGERLERLGETVNISDLLALGGDVERGKQVFFRDGTASCKSCHKIGNDGATLGPDLSQIGKKYPKQELLTHLLEPSKFMEPKYVPMILETVEGRVFTGLLVEQNDREVVLKDAQQEHRVTTDEVELLVPQQKSLMPDLLLRDLTPQQAADLLAFLSSLK